MGYWFWVIVLAIICALIGGAITDSKGRGWGEGVAFGALLGLIGLLVVAFLKPTTQPLGSSAGPIPGWYPDGDRGLRWWDGSRWTDVPIPPAS